VNWVIVFFISKWVLSCCTERWSNFFYALEFSVMVLRLLHWVMTMDCLCRIE
jgi:hypothetical protein